MNISGQGIGGIVLGNDGGNGSVNFNNYNGGSPVTIASISPTGAIFGGYPQRQQLSVGSYLDIYSGALNSPSTNSIRATSNAVVINGLAGGVYFNYDVSSGAGPVYFFSGGASPALVANISTAGVGTFTGVNSTAAGNLFKTAAQTYLDLWNSTTGGTPSTGAHWRLFSDNVGGGGGSLTFGFYDVANGRLPFGIDNTGLTTCIGLSSSGAIQGTLGGWIAWTPVVSVSLPMAATAASSITASYLRIGPVVHFRCRFTTTLGGTMGGSIVVTGIPVAEYTGLPVILSGNVNGNTQDNVTYIGAGSITFANSVAFTAGSNTFSINGTYQCSA